MPYFKIAVLNKPHDSKATTSSIKMLILSLHNPSETPSVTRLMSTHVIKHKIEIESLEEMYSPSDKVSSPLSLRDIA